jgi:pimeloyl-ACP methyl ester carboxylesterase
MFAGTIIEEGPVGKVFAEQRHPYTQSLIASTPKQIAVHGFASAGDYYRECSSLQVIKEIQIPTLVILAKNDPMLARGNYGEVNGLNPRVRFLILEEGGHCGFWGSGLL